MQVLKPEFIHADSRRALTQLLTDAIKQINHYEAKKGAVLGNHFHVKTREFFYILKGSIRYNKLKILNKNSLFVVEPGEKHSLECLTDVNMMTFLTKAYSEEDPDIYTEIKGNKGERNGKKN